MVAVRQLHRPICGYVAAGRNFCAWMRPGGQARTARPTAPGHSGNRVGERISPALLGGPPEQKIVAGRLVPIAPWRSRLAPRYRVIRSRASERVAAIGRSRRERLSPDCAASSARSSHSFVTASLALTQIALECRARALDQIEAAERWR